MTSAKTVFSNHTQKGLRSVRLVYATEDDSRLATLNGEVDSTGETRWSPHWDVFGDFGKTLHTDDEAKVVTFIATGELP